MKKWFIKPCSEASSFWQAFWIFVDWEDIPVTSHFCSHSWYADMDLIRHEAAKEFDVIYWVLWNIAYMNWEATQITKDKFNEAESKWRASKYGTKPPSEHLV